jgi:hypothetical protein
MLARFIMRISKLTTGPFVLPDCLMMDIILPNRHRAVLPSHAQRAVPPTYNRAGSSPGMTAEHRRFESVRKTSSNA